MADRLKIELVTPYRRVLSDEIDEITAPGSAGEFAVLPGHAPFLSSLTIGELSFRKDGVDHYLAVNSGYFEVNNDQVTILVETAELADQIDLERAKIALGRAEEALKGLSQDDKAYKIQEAALQRALIRMQVAGKKSEK